MPVCRRTALLQGLLFLTIRCAFSFDSIGELFGEDTMPVGPSSGPILFDLNVDPNEYSQITVDPISSNYSDIYSQLLTRSAYWSSFVKTAESPDTSINKKKYWKEAKGIVSWVLDTDFTPRTIPLKYVATDQPNIVFVLVDDWGWNDVGFRSTYMNWTTPNIDRLAAEGVNLNNYFTSYLCTPTRGALLTGRYPIRLGLAEAGSSAELPLNETTLAQEMQSAGYRTYMVGKWHLGYSTPAHTPSERGFDSSYTYWNGFVDYWTKFASGYIDLHDNSELVTETAETSDLLHNGYLMQTKAEAAIADHVANYSSMPMFLYYAMQLVHGEWSAPDSFLDRCGFPVYVEGNGDYDDYVANVTYQYCALNVMLDEAVGNLTCALEKYGMADNTILVLVSDNGGEETIPGNSHPFIGNKGSYFRGGVSATGLVHSKLLPTDVRGTSYNGQMHVTDWLPTLMGLATNNQWTRSLFGIELDGVDQWEAITTPDIASPRSEILHYHNGSSISSIQIDMVKLNLGDLLKAEVIPDYFFYKDNNPDSSQTTCENPSLMEYESKKMKQSQLLEVVPDNYYTTRTSLILLFLVVAYFVLKSLELARKSPKNDRTERVLVKNNLVDNSVNSTYGSASNEYSQIGEKSSLLGEKSVHCAQI